MHPDVFDVYNFQTIRRVCFLRLACPASRTICATSYVQVGSSVEFVESDGQVVEVSCIEGKPRNVFERWDNASWRMKQALNNVLRRQGGQQAA